MHYFITGGTGSFGHAMVLRLLSEPDIERITVFSRDEDKQEQMHRSLGNDRLHFVVGDIRDYDAVCRAMDGVDAVFHAAALKQVPSCEANPMEAIRTNLLGSDNVFRAAEHCHVQVVVALSTDKACYPINTMGMCKALMEKLMLNYARRRVRNYDGTIFCATRYGNVAGSRGSVIPLFIDNLKRGKPLQITDPTMTRFLLSMDDALNLVVHALTHAEPGCIYVLKAPATTVAALGEAVCNLFGAPYNPEIIGVRPGEKRDETLVTKEEMQRVIDDGDFYRIPPDIAGGLYNDAAEAFTSDTAFRLSVEQIMDKLSAMQFIQEAQRAR